MLAIREDLQSTRVTETRTCSEVNLARRHNHIADRAMGLGGRADPAKPVDLR